MGIKKLIFRTKGAEPGFSTNYAGTGVNVAGAKGDWQNPGLITANDAAFATGNPGNNDFTDILRATNFTLAIPSGATIDGITAKVYRIPNAGADLGEISDYDVYLAIGGTKKGNSKTIGAGWDHTQWITATYGGAADLWGTTWTAANINDTTFGLDFIIQKSGTNLDRGFVDWIEITVNYTA